MSSPHSATDVVVAASTRERLALAELLCALDDGQWAAASWCAGWSVRAVVAHLVSALDPRPWPFLLAVARAGGRLHRANDALAQAGASRPAEELVALLRERADSRAAPPVTGPRGPLTDVLVHGQDIAGPLGVVLEPSPTAVRAALDFVTTGRPVGFVPRGRLRGLRLVAPDLGTSWGSGTELTGRGIDLLVAACGRPAALPALGGDGAAVLAARLGR